MYTNYVFCHGLGDLLDIKRIVYISGSSEKIEKEEGDKMEQRQIEILKLRNKKIIDIVLQQIKTNCPDSIELIGIGGSFCNGDIYENSDLDLVLICKDEKAKCLDKCFILENVGFDIYTHDWGSFDSLALYPNPYVTKLIDLDIIYANDDALKHYKSLQEQVKINMQNEELITKNISCYFSNALENLNELDSVSDISIAYRLLAKIIKNVEFIIYMLNSSYVKGGTKRVPEEITNMKILPKNFIEVYSDIVNCSNIEDIKQKSRLLVNSVKELLDNRDISYSISVKEEIKSIKKDITSDNLKGTYEEIYSNWKNKMLHAFKINSRYLSFVTMAGCQEFYDDMYEQFNIPQINLIGKYKPDNLFDNIDSFNLAMSEWKNLYDQFGIDINYYNNLKELENLYSNKSLRK